MSNTVKMSIAGAVLALALLLALAPVLLRAVNSADTPSGTGGTESAAEDSTSNMDAGLPACPEPGEGSATSSISAEGGPLAGVTMDCLGAPGDGTDLQTALAGKPAVINVWAWNCAPCRNELPLFDQLQQQRSDLTVVGVHENAHAKKGIEFAQSVGLKMPSWLDNDGRFAAALELPNVVPQTIVLHADGTVAAKFPKTFTSVAELEQSVNDALR